MFDILKNYKDEFTLRPNDAIYDVFDCIKEYRAIESKCDKDTIEAISTIWWYIDELSVDDILDIATGNYRIELNYEKSKSINKKDYYSFEVYTDAHTDAHEDTIATTNKTNVTRNPIEGCISFYPDQHKALCKLISSKPKVKEGILYIFRLFAGLRYKDHVFDYKKNYIDVKNKYHVNDISYLYDKEELLKIITDNKKELLNQFMNIVSIDSLYSVEKTVENRYKQLFTVAFNPIINDIIVDAIRGSSLIESYKNYDFKFRVKFLNTTLCCDFKDTESCENFLSEMMSKVLIILKDENQKTYLGVSVRILIDNMIRIERIKK